MFLAFVLFLFITLYSELKSVRYSVRHSHVLNCQLSLLCPEREVNHAVDAGLAALCKLRAMFRRKEYWMMRVKRKFLGTLWGCMI